MKHIVGFSGGIDSQACARWVLNRYPAEDVILMNSNAGGNEDEITVEFVADYSERVHPVVSVTAIHADIWETEGYAERRGFDGNAPLDFPTMMAIKGTPPTSKKQFCTDILKLRPQRRWIHKEFGPGGMYERESYTRYSGKRRDESERRKDTPYHQWDSWFDCDLFAPLIDWPKQWCFDYVKRHGEAINPLYSMGFERVGCAPCINSRKADILKWAERRPAMIDKIRAWEARLGMTFLRPVDRNRERNDGQRDGIDEQVRWARTAHGGKKVFLPMMTERSGCESKYGTCE